MGTANRALYTPSRDSKASPWLLVEQHPERRAGGCGDDQVRLHAHETPGGGDVRGEPDQDVPAEVWRRGVPAHGKQQQRPGATTLHGHQARGGELPRADRGEDVEIAELNKQIENIGK